MKAPADSDHEKEEIEENEEQGSPDGVKENKKPKEGKFGSINEQGDFLVTEKQSHRIKIRFASLYYKRLYTHSESKKNTVEDPQPELFKPNLNRKSM
jgi:hypothetical protein